MAGTAVERDDEAAAIGRMISEGAPDLLNRRRASGE